MQPAPYLVELTVRLATGLAEVDDARREEFVRFIISKQQDDGGFCGREGGSDLYYTSFALRSLSILGVLDGPLAEHAGNFLRQRLAGQETIVDFVSLLYSAFLLQAATSIDVFDSAHDGWRDQVAQVLNDLKRDDGGYAKAAEGNASSTYHTFLVLLCLQLIERPLPEPQRVVEFIHSQQADDGGFREIRLSKRGGTNPTAAAIATLRILDALDDEIRESTIDFLAEMQTDEGGLRANTRIPIADLLSTFTGLLTLIDLDSVDEIDSRAMLRYANSLQQSDGGFVGAAWDTVCDVEYTFYGIGNLAILKTI